MRPERVESNHFAYHLEQLIKNGFITKQDKAYRLSPDGLAYVDSLSQGKMVVRRQPNISTMIDVTTPDGQTLLFKRNFQPYLHLAGLPLGKLHYEETVAEAAARELEEKTNLTGLALEHRGMVYVHVSKDGTTITRILCHVFHADVPEPLPVSIPPERGEVFWANHRTLDPSTLAPGFLRVKELLAGSDQLFFDEITERL
ncbi:MAG TPA: NUDIX domain-containing protein [Candidatus Saccharimonadales bacterium]|nr:NUDIX domain-containing protein [Candidatus Saccharimonadales bacterium]